MRGLLGGDWMWRLAPAVVMLGWLVCLQCETSLAGELAQSLPGRLNRVYMHLQSAVPQRMDDLAEPSSFLLMMYCR